MHQSFFLHYVEFFIGIGDIMLILYYDNKYSAYQNLMYDLKIFLIIILIIDFHNILEKII